MSEIDDDDIIDPKVEKRLNQTAATLTVTATEKARQELQEKVRQYLEAGGKISKVESGSTGFTKPSIIYAEHSVKAAAKKNRSGKGRFTERQKLICDRVIEAMGGRDKISFETLSRVMKGKPDNLRQSLAILHRKGFLKCEGDTIRKGFVS